MYRGNRPPHRHMVEYIVLFHAPRQKTAAFAYRVDFHSFMTRPLGVRVDGPTGRRLWPPDGGGLCKKVVFTSLMGGGGGFAASKKGARLAPQVV